MADTSQEIVNLNKRITATRERLIRFQTKRDGLESSKQELLKEIRDAGYDPDNLPALQEQLQKELMDKKRAIESQLTEAEKILNSIPE